MRGGYVSPSPTFAFTYPGDAKINMLAPKDMPDAVLSICAAAKFIFHAKFL